MRIRRKSRPGRPSGRRLFTIPATPYRQAETLCCWRFFTADQAPGNSRRSPARQGQHLPPANETALTVCAAGKSLVSPDRACREPSSTSPGYQNEGFLYSPAGSGFSGEHLSNTGSGKPYEGVVSAAAALCQRNPPAIQPGERTERQSSHPANQRIAAGARPSQRQDR